MTAFLIAISFASSYALTYLTKHYAIKKNILDLPVCRSSHQVPTPRGGGLAIVITFIILVFFSEYADIIDSQYTLIFIVPSLLVAAIGFLDDHRPVKSQYRLMVHFVSSILALYFLPDLPIVQFGEVSVTNPVILYPLYTIGLVWVLNLYNFMDGIDGVAGSEAISILILAAIILYLISDHHWISFLLAISAVVSGFLIWNWAPASIFLGDVGSGFLGFLIGLLALVIATDSPLNIWAWLILLAAFIADSTWTLIARMVTGQKWHQPHHNHAYQILARKTNSHAIINLGLIAINLFWLGPMAWYATTRPDIGWLLALLAYSPLVLLCRYSRAGTSVNEITNIN